MSQKLNEVIKPNDSSQWRFCLFSPADSQKPTMTNEHKKASNPYL